MIYILFLILFLLILFFYLNLLKENRELKKKLDIYIKEKEYKEEEEEKDTIPINSLNNSIKTNKFIDTTLINNNNINKVKENRIISIPKYNKKIREVEIKEINNTSLDNNFNVREFVNNREGNIITLEKKNNKYIEDVIDSINKEINNNIIELTDFEKEEEESAVISYQELLKNKDKVFIDDDNLDKDFIEELKNFRNRL